MSYSYGQVRIKLITQFEGEVKNSSDLTFFVKLAGWYTYHIQEFWGHFSPRNSLLLQEPEALMTSLSILVFACGTLQFSFLTTEVLLSN